MPASEVLRIAKLALIAEEEYGGSAPRTVKLGQTEEQIRRAMGDPDTVADLGEKKILVYAPLKVTLVNGVVTDVE